MTGPTGRPPREQEWTDAVRPSVRDPRRPPRGGAPRWAARLVPFPGSVCRRPPGQRARSRPRASLSAFPRRARRLAGLPARPEHAVPGPPPTRPSALSRRRPRPAGWVPAVQVPAAAATAPSLVPGPSSPARPLGAPLARGTPRATKRRAGHPLSGRAARVGPAGSERCARPAARGGVSESEPEETRSGAAARSPPPAPRPRRPRPARCGLSSRNPGVGAPEALHVGRGGPGRPRRTSGPRLPGPTLRGPAPGARARRAALAPKCVTGTGRLRGGRGEAGAGPARAGPGVPGRLGAGTGRGSRSVARPSARGGGPLAAGSAPGTGPQPRGARRRHWPWAPLVSSRRRARFPPGETRGSSRGPPRPAPPPAPSLAGQPGPGSQWQGPRSAAAHSPAM